MTENTNAFEQNAAQPSVPAYSEADANAAAAPVPNTQIYVQQAPPSQTNGMAIAGIICAFLFPLLGLIFSIIGLNKSKQMNGEGRGVSIAGIVISAILLLLGIVLYIAFFAAVASYGY